MRRACTRPGGNAPALCRASVHAPRNGYRGRDRNPNRDRKGPGVARKPFCVSLTVAARSAILRDSARHALVCSLALLTCAGGCDRHTRSDSPEKPAAAAATQPGPAERDALRAFVQEQGGPAPAQGLPPGHPPMSAAPQSAPALPPSHPPVAGAGAELKYDVPPDWKPVPPDRPTRKAQYVLPRVEGDPEDGELIVFYFGPGEGGGVHDNLMRWRGMFTRPDGSPLPADHGTSETFEAGGLRVTLLDVSGRYAPAPMPGMGATPPRDNFRMLAAVVETPSGPWFFKATGPAETMSRHREAIRSMLASVKP